MADSKQIQSLYDAWSRSPTPQKASEIVDGLRQDMDYAIQQHGGKVSPLTRGMAKSIVVDSLKTYKPSKDTQFRSWAQTQLQRLSRPLRATKFSVKIPELRAREAQRVRDAVNDIEAETGFEPDDLTLADRLGIPMTRAHQVRTSLSPEVISGDADMTAPVDENRDDSRLVQDMVYHSLPPRDRTIMEYTFGYNGVKPIPGNKLSAKLKVTPAAISQRVSLIKSMLQEAREVTGG